MSAAARPKRLIEVAFPLAQVSKQAAREKNIRHGHISTLHIWWARRPLVAARAVTFAVLVPDPDDPHCPAAFRDTVGKLIARYPEGACGLEQPCDLPHGTLRGRLLHFLAAISTWEASNDPIMDTARELVRVATDSKTPRILDPFAGGGALPLEALRLGCEAYASDLNPVAVLLLKCTLEYPQRFRDGPRGKGKPIQQRLDPGTRGVQAALPATGGDGRSRLAEDVRYWGNWVLERAKKELAPYYPPGPKGETPVAYLWARTVKCPNPACGVEMPLIRQYWLAKKVNKGLALKPQSHGPGKPVTFSIVEVGPKETWPDDGNIGRGGAFVCQACGSPGSEQYLEDEYKAHRGGTRLLAVVGAGNGRQGKTYRLAAATDENVFTAVQRCRTEVSGDLVPSEPIFNEDTRHFSTGRFGLETFAELFSPRQLLALTTFVRLVREASAEIRKATGDPDYTDAVVSYLALGTDRLADYNSSLTRWVAVGEFVGNTFTRQALPMVWDHVEVNPASEQTGGFRGAIEWIVRVIEHESLENIGEPYQQDAAATANGYGPWDAVITDPPYYDAISYADLSDFFYVWLKRMLAEIHPDLFRTPLTPKQNELIQQPIRHGGNKKKAREFYEQGMASAFAAVHDNLKPDGVFIVVFAHSSTDAWEALLTGIIRRGFQATAAWPIHTERDAAIRKQGASAFSASVWLVCRPRMQDETGDWGSVQLELEQHLPARLRALWDQGARGADFLLAGIGPGMEVFSRYARVERLDGSPVTVGQFLDGFLQPFLVRFAAEELPRADERTRFYYVWRMAFADATLPSGEAIKLAQGTGVDLDRLVQTGFLEKRGGKYTLRGRGRVKDERDPSQFGTPAWAGGHRPADVDALHALLHHHRETGTGAAAAYLRRADLVGDNGPWRLAQALSSALERVGGEEMRECQDLLSARDAIIQQARQRGGEQQAMQGV